eukprot:329277-Prorocentrum_minimum.AAC.1
MSKPASDIERGNEEAGTTFERAGRASAPERVRLLDSVVGLMLAGEEGVDIRVRAYRKECVCWTRWWG